MRGKGNQGLRWENYVGDTLRGELPVNRLIPQDPYLVDMLQLEQALSNNSEHIMLLTTAEAEQVIKELYNTGTTFAGNIRDGISGTKNIVKLFSYQDTGKLVFTLKGLGIKAIPYIYNGVTYIKITGYPSVRRILNGTRYAVNNPKILELGIGKAGLNAGILSGARFCIYFSAAQRTMELIFSSEHDVAAFIGNITMDVSKVIVSMFVTKVVVEITKLGVTKLASTLAFSAILPIPVGMVIIVTLGVIVTLELFLLDEKLHLSHHLIESIKKGMDEHRKIMEWNLHNSTPYLFSLTQGHK